MRFAVNQATLMKTPMTTFLEAIAKAGFEGVELRRDETFEYLKTNSIEDLIYHLDINGLECITFNAIELFSLCPEDEFRKILEYTERLMEIGVEIGCDTIIAVPSFIGDNPLDPEKVMSQTIRRLRKIADIAERYDFKVGFEPLGFHNCSVRKIEHALAIIKHEILPEMGLIIDTFHYFVGEHKVEELKTINADKLWLVHINDSVEKPLEQLQDSDRVMPDEGFFKLKSFIKTLKNIGYDGWLSLELFNEKIWKEDPYKVAINAINSINKLI